MGATSRFGHRSMVLLTIAIVTIWSNQLSFANAKHGAKKNVRAPVSLNCSLPQTLVDEIAAYSTVARQIADHILDGPAKNLTYNYLADFVDKFGSRHVGTQNLEDSIDYMVTFLQALGLQNVHTEDATVPVWNRNNESLTMIQPRYKELGLLGLGSSVGTSLNGITAEVLVVDSFDDLDSKAALVPGKIVVYNEPWIDYGTTVEYRGNGANVAAKYGAVAALVKSVTPFSIYSPHTGDMDYDSSISPVKIPTACITVEDAELMRRMADRGETIVLSLYMAAENLADAISRNTIAEWSGTTYPKEVVVVSGHIDSWDVGQGAMDDGGGVFIALMTPYILKQLGLQSKRPVRTILWTSEETGYHGAYAYAAGHVQDLPDFNIMIESDEGTFNPLGLAFSGVNEAACIVQEVLKLSGEVGATQLFMPDDGSDTLVFSALAVPTGSLVNQNDKYFYFHHSDGDTMTVLDPDELDRCLVFWSITSYVLADISVKLPRN